MQFIDLLWYNVSHGNLQPYPDRVKPILELSVPKSRKELLHIVGMFSYTMPNGYQNLQKNSKPLIVAETFHLSADAVSAFKQLQQNLTNATLDVINEQIPFVIETNASENAISAALNQQN